MSANKGVPAWAFILILVLIFLPVIQTVVQQYSSQLGIQWPEDVDDGVDYPTIGDVSVNRKIAFAVQDVYGGSAVSSGTLVLYESNGAQLESLTLSSSTTTTKSYPSGKEIYGRLINSNAKRFYKIIVPKMAQADVDSQTNNPVELDFFAIASYTVKISDQAGNQISTGGNYNKTTTGDQATLTINFWVSSDNTGIMDSEAKDILNDLNWYCVLYMKSYNTNYEYIDVTGWDHSWSRGTANWYAQRLVDTDLTKYKVGNTYVYDGSTSFTFSADFSSYSGDAADLVFYLDFYSDPYHMMDHGNAGPDYYEAATFTLNCVD